MTSSISALMEMAKQVNAYFDGPLTNALLTGTDTEWESCHSQHQQLLHKLRGLAKMATLCGTTTTIMTAEKTVDEDELAGLHLLYLAGAERATG